MRKNDTEQEQQMLISFIEMLKSSPIAVEEKAANEQHYEVPAEFFHRVLGKYKKYSCCYWPKGVNNLDDAEQAMLEIICNRADLKDGQHILDLGCGWGSFSLYAAKKYPKATVTGLSNSKGQHDYIMQQCKNNNIQNLQIITANIAEYLTDKKYDRIVSIEMFEHMRNLELLLKKLSTWLNTDGKMFIHIFTHVNYPYLFTDNWTADNFFTGGMMPCDQLLLYFQNDMRILNHWRVNGTHYKKTADAWLENLDENKEIILDLFSKENAQDAVEKMLSWRMFFLTCAESFGYNKGQDWIVSHYLMQKR